MPDYETPQIIDEAADINPFKIAAKEIKCLTDRPRVTMETWADDVAAISKAAAASGKFKESLDGMAMLGEHFGCLNKNQSPAEQHLHLHGASSEALKEIGTNDLESRLAQLKAREAQKHAEPEQPSEPEDDPTNEDTDWLT